jgi:YbbR domain-containing protein
MMNLKSDWIVFCLCLAAAILFWWQINNREVKTYNLEFLLQFNLPDSLKISNIVPDKVEVNFEMKPGDYRDFIKKNPNTTIIIDLGTSPEQVISGQFISSKIRELLSAYPVQRIGVKLQEDLIVRVITSYFKKVKVHLESKMEFYPGYELIDSVRIDPDSITIFGIKEAIDSLKSWPTELLNQVAIREDIKQLLKLKTPKDQSISLSHTYVDVLAEVDQFTEKEMTVPVNIVTSGNKSQLQYKILPNQARIFAKLSVSNFNLLLESDLKLGAEIDSIKGKTNLAPIKLLQKPDYVKDVKIYPKYVEVIIHN